MPSNTRSTKHTRQNSDVVMIPAEIAKRPKTKQKTQRKENCPVNSGEIIEISSDEDEVSVAPRNGVAMSKLHEKIKQLEQENARIRGENEEMKKKQMLEAVEMEDQVTCEVCDSKMWSPFILPGCGHTFCQQDLENWFATALKQHRTIYPQYDVNYVPPGNNPYYQPLPAPAYSCPKCREPVRSKPMQNFALKPFVRSIASKTGETSPKKTPGNPQVWNRFFAAR
ncbi:hypothetical protein C8J57DRAFT_210905 [Mycena rebaudengoi]|nr:hypothetical protein C8J57DRAFT_210905 [Mycena rebaudengoi]